MKDPNAAAWKLIETSLTNAEDKAESALSQLEQLIALCAENQRDVHRNHKVTMDALNKLGATTKDLSDTVNKLYEVVFVQEGRIGRIEQDHSRANGHTDAE